jgi:hypothetical protein
MLIIYPDTIDPLIYPAKLLEIWQEGDVLYLKLWNYNKDKWEFYAQDLTTEDCLFSFVSIPFITKLAEVMTCRCKPESSMENKQSINEPVQSKSSSVNLKDKPALSQPFYNSSGKMVMKYISASEILLNLPFILTQDKRLKLNKPYIKTENKLSCNDITAIRLLNFEVNKSIIQLYVKELKSKKTYSLEWNMDYAGGYWLWNLSDFETILGITQK